MSNALKLRAYLESAKVQHTPGELKLIQLHGLRALKSANDNSVRGKK